MTTESNILQIRKEILSMRESTCTATMSYWRGGVEKQIHLCFLFQIIDGEMYKALNRELAYNIKEWYDEHCPLLARVGEDA